MIETEERREGKTGRLFGVSLVLCAVGIVMLLIFALVVFPSGITRGAQAAEDMFMETESRTESDIREKIYAAAFDLSEKEYHVKNTANAEIKCVELTQKLEVLRVSDVEYIFTGDGTTDDASPEQKFDNDSGVTAWFEVSGTGSFAVDLTQAEVAVDNARKHISVVLPLPEVKCRESGFKLLKVDDNHINFMDSEADGIEIAKTAKRKGLELIDGSVGSDPDYMESARSSAKRLLSNMIKSLNAEEIPDLSVDVSFFDE